MRRIFDRVPLLWKYLIISGCVFLSFYISFYLFSQRILLVTEAVLKDYTFNNIQIPCSIFQGDFVWFFIWGALISVVLLMLMYYDLVYLLDLEVFLFLNFLHLQVQLREDKWG